MKLWFAVILPVLVLGADAVPAFPGAEGFGAGTPGGRGGKVIFVRNLDDSGPGSFRDACEMKGPRMIVFRVAGIVDLKKAIRISEPYATIAGQTAPGDGVCFRGSEISIRTHDVIMRFIRSRPGDISEGEVDAINIAGDSRNVILDHCSATWSIDEALSPSGAISDVTVQWCLIAEGLNKSHHSKGAHGYGSLVRAVGGLTLHHNLWAHNNSRNPRLGDNYQKPPYPTFDVRNNVMYDYGSVCSGMTGDILKVNYVGNYIRPGPSSNRAKGQIVFTDTASATYYVKGNFVEGNAARTADNTKMFDRVEAKGRRLVTTVAEPFETPAVKVTSAEAPYQAVLEQVGATRPVRDRVDARIIEEVRAHTGGIIDSQKDVGGWPVYKSTSPPADTDGDGIPDEWEVAHGLNPRDPSDASAVDGSGYTNIEKYINSLGAPSLR